MAVELSIIIPVYNAMPYLQDCLESCYEQDIDLDRYEIIAIDDGSTDGSASYLDEQAEIRKNLIVIHQDNTGSPAGPRNLGIKQARGEYIFFCDADDRFFPNVFNSMLRKAADLRFDVGCFQIDRQGRTGDYRGLFQSSRNNVSADDYSLLSLFGPYKLIRRSLLIDNGIQFVPNIAREDQPFSLECYLTAGSISIISDMPYYQYRMRDDGISASLGGLSELFDKEDSYIDGLKAYFNAADKYTKPSKMARIYYRAYEGIVSDLRLLQTSPNFEDYVEQYREIALSHYCNEIRGTLPFNMLIGIDALCISDNLDDIREALNVKDNICPIAFNHTSDGTSYKVHNSNTQNCIFSASWPKDDDIKEQLLNPGFKRNYINRAMISEKNLVIEGFLDALFTSDASADARLFVRIKSLNTARDQDFECILSDSSFQDAYLNVKFLATNWSCCIPLENIVLEEQDTQLDIYTVLKPATGEEHEYRSGALRDRCAPSTFLSKAELLDKVAFIPHETGRNNFSLKVNHAETLVAASTNQKITGISWTETLLSLQGEVLVPTKEHISAAIKLMPSNNESQSDVMFPCQISEVNGRAGLIRNWTTEITTEQLLKPELTPERWLFVLRLESSAGFVELPLGKRRFSGSLRLFQAGAFSSTKGSVIPSKTIEDKLCIYTKPQIQLEDCCIECRIKKLEWHGHQLMLQGTFHAPAPPDKVTILIRSASIKPGKKLCKRYPATHESSSEWNLFEYSWRAALDIDEVPKLVPLLTTLLDKNIDYELGLFVELTYEQQKTVLQFGYQRPKGTIALFKAGEFSSGRIRVTPAEDSSGRLIFKLSRCE